MNTQYSDSFFAEFNIDPNSTNVYSELRHILTAFKRQIGSKFFVFKNRLVECTFDNQIKVCGECTPEFIEDIQKILPFLNKENIDIRDEGIMDWSCTIQEDGNDAVITQILIPIKIK